MVPKNFDDCSRYDNIIVPTTIIKILWNHRNVLQYCPTYYYHQNSLELPKLRKINIENKTTDNDLHTLQYNLCPKQILCTIDEVLFLIKSLDFVKS